MRKVILFIAMSLDGYIADRYGKVDWLTGENGDDGDDDSYEAFVKEIDTVIMGHRTYRQIVEELSPEKWVYDGLQSYVITHRKYPSTPNITFVSADPCRLVNEIKHTGGKDIWICGGAEIVRGLMCENLIDRYHIFVIPTIMGSGIPLFHAMEHEIRLRLTASRSRNGITELIYEKR